jgi:hypothetical protein
MAIDSSLNRSSSLLDSITLPSGSISASVRPALLGQYSFGVGVVNLQYRYAASAPAAWSTLTATTKFNDIAPTDPDGRTTYESGSYSGFYNRIFGALSFGTAITITQFTAQVYSFMDGAAALPNRTYSIYTSNDGVTWSVSGLSVTLGNGWTEINWTGSLTCAYLGLYVVGTNANQIPVEGRIGTFRLPPPPAPVLTANFCFAAGTSVSLSWATVSVAVNYRVYRDGALVATVTAPTTSYVATSQSIAESHTWTVRTWDGISESADSNAVVGLTEYAISLSVITATTDCSVPGVKSLLVSWTAPPSVSTVTYVLKQDGTTIYSGTDRSFLAQNLESGTVYTFAVTATNTCGTITSTNQAQAAGWLEDCIPDDGVQWTAICIPDDGVQWTQVASDADSGWVQVTPSQCE